MPTPVFDGFIIDANNEFEHDNKLYVKFFPQAVYNAAKSEDAGRPIFDEVDMIQVMTPGSRDSFVGKASQHYQFRFARQWAAYKAGKEQSADGTPIEEVPFLSVSQVAELKAVNVKTLEHLANMPDVLLQKFMGAHALKQRAQLFLNAAKDNAPMIKLQSELEKRDNEIAVLQRQMSELMAAKAVEDAAKQNKAS